MEISGNKRKRNSLQIKVDFYKVCLSKIIYCLLFLFYDYTNTLFLSRQICGIFLNRGKGFRKYCTKGFESEEDKRTDKWWREKLIIDGFNEAGKNIDASSLKVGYESMRVISFRTMAKGNLTH